jgi:hypothetical protein
MDEIMADAKLLKSLKAGSQDASKSRYSIVKGGVKGH